MKAFLPFLVLLFSFVVSSIYAQKHELQKYSVTIYKKESTKKVAHREILNSLENNSVNLSSDYYSHFEN